MTPASTLLIAWYCSDPCGPFCAVMRDCEKGTSQSLFRFVEKFDILLKEVN